MALLIKTRLSDEDGDSYISVAYADEYHEKRGNTLWDTMSVPEKEASCIRATDYIDQTYGGKWKAEYLEELPAEVEKATAEMAFRAAQGELDSDLEQGIIREKVGPLETEYDKNSSQSKRYPVIDKLLRSVCNLGMSLKTVRV